MGRLRTGLALAALMLTALGPAPSTASEARSFERVYDLFLGGLRLAEMRFEGMVSDGNYEMRAQIATTPLIAWLFTAEVDARAEGRVTPAGYLPQRFASDSESSRRGERRIRMNYAGGAPVLSVEPPWDGDDADYGLDPAGQAGLPDPLSAALLAMAPATGEAVCGRRVEVFDGRRRYAVALGAAEPSPGGVKCTALYTRIGGFEPDRMDEPDFPFEVRFIETGDGSLALDMALGETPRGTVAVRLRR